MENKITSFNAISLESNKVGQILTSSIVFEKKKHKTLLKIYFESSEINFIGLKYHNKKLSD